MTFSHENRRARELFVFAFMVFLFFFWAVPVTTIAGFLSYKEIKKTLPWLAHWIDMNATIQALVQNSAPSLAMTALNAALPFILEGTPQVLRNGSIF
jgi:calcium permeable stress-gated cation channel